MHPDRSAVEHRPANAVPQSLIIKDKLADLVGQLVALPSALAPTGAFPFTFRRGRTRRLDRISGRSELVRSDMRHRRGLTGSVRGMARRSAEIPGRRHRVAGGRARLGHPDLAARPCASPLDCVTWPQVGRLHRLEQW